MVPKIGIIAANDDFAALSVALAEDGCARLLDESSAIAAARAGELDLLIVSPRVDWWTEAAGIAAFKAELIRLRLVVLAMVPQHDAGALAFAFDSNVADFTAYPFDPAEVAVRVRILLRRKAAADRLRRETEYVRRIALTDPVTGLWNRHYLDKSLAREIEAADGASRPLSLLMIDIDRFKPINDRFGHAIGDKVLRAVALRLTSGIRGNDTLARFGGDEIALIMPDTALAVAHAVAERLCELVADGTTEVPFAVTVSIGVAELEPNGTAMSLLAYADKALYAAKRSGRNAVAAAPI